MTPKYVKVHIVKHKSTYCLSSVSVWTVSVLSFIMAGLLLFVILMYSCRGIQVQAGLPPTLIVNPAVITETETVTLNCQAPPSVSVSQCYIYIVGRESPKILSCMETLTGSELLKMTRLSSPAEVKVKCFYTVKQGHVHSPSPHSDASSISIHSQKPQMSVQPFDDHVLFTCSLPGPANDDTRCILYFGEASHLAVTATAWNKKMSNSQRFCHFYVTTDDLLRHLRSVQQSDASCDYSSGSDPNSLSPRSDRYSLTDIVKRESSMASTRAPFTTTTGVTAAGPSYTGSFISASLTPVRPTSDLMDRPGTSTTPVKPAEDIVEKETDMTLSMPPSTVTTGLTDSKLHASTPVTPTKQPPGVTAAGPGYTGSFTSASLTPVRPTSGQTPPKPGTNANSFPVTPPNPTSETWTWKLVVAAAYFGGVVFLGLALLCAKRRTGNCLQRSPGANGSNKSKFACGYMKSLNRAEYLPSGYDETYSIVSYEFSNTE